MIKSSPCKNCQERHYNCHSECQRYNDWRIEQHAIKHYVEQHEYIRGSLNYLTEASKRRILKIGKKTRHE